MTVGKQMIINKQESEISEKNTMLHWKFSYDFNHRQKNPISVLHNPSRIDMPLKK